MGLKLALLLMLFYRTWSLEAFIVIVSSVPT